MLLKVLNKSINLRLLLFLLLLCMCGDVLPKNPYKNGEVGADYPKGCSYLNCKRGEQCVNRKFWCKNPPCPSMLYCSKSRKESLKGPSSCEAVRCTKGFICLARVRHCRWDQSCQQQIARCVSERDYYDGAASCVDFKCPTGLGCILRESLCAKAPCKLVKSCASTKDVKTWYAGCKSLGCLSEHECFLRRPSRDCRTYPCKHTPDCAAKSEVELEANEQCRGWVCPKGEECSAHTQGPCKRDNCRISRSCHRPLMLPLNVTSGPKHSWRDDVKLSFYSKVDKNMSTPGINGLSDLSTNNVEEFHENSIYASPNPRPASSRPWSVSPDIISGRVVQPTVTSLSTWLNHLKLKTGVDAIEAWIKKAEKQENYRSFIEWLESVKDMLGSAAYNLWIEELRTMTVTSPAFQKWLPPTPKKTNDVNNQGLEISTGSQKSIQYRNNEYKNYSRQGWINGDAQEVYDARKLDDFNDETYIFPPKNETPISLSPQQINEWQQFYNPNPRLVQQVYPFQSNIGNFPSWINKKPFQRLVDPMNYRYQQYQHTPSVDSYFLNDQTWQGQLSPIINTRHNQESMDPRFLEFNESFQQPPNPGVNFLRYNPQRDQMFIDPFLELGKTSQNSQFFPSNTWQFRPSSNPQQQQQQIFKYNDPNFLSPTVWQKKLFPPLNSDSRQERDPHNQYDRRIILNEGPLQVYSDNSTSENISWIKYFLDQTSQRHAPPENIGTLPITGENLGYESWPGSSYQGWSLLSDVPHRRTKHEDSTRDSVSERPGQTSRELLEDTAMFHSYYLHLLNQDRRNLYEENNREVPSALAIASRSDRTDADARSPSSNPFFKDNNQPDAPRFNYHFPNTYLHDRLYRLYSTIGNREYDECLDPPRELKRPEAIEDRTLGFAYRDKEFDAPGQPMGVPDLWNPKFRTPLSSVVQKLDGQRWNFPNAIEKKHPISTTISTPVVSSSTTVAHDDCQKDLKDIETYGDDDDDDDDDVIFPLVLSLQGYIETSKEEGPDNLEFLTKNSTILPVYTVKDGSDEDEDYSDDYASPQDRKVNLASTSGDQGINLFKNEIYGGTPDFPKNLKSVFDMEAALVIQNTTGESDVEIKDVKWEYEDNDDDIFGEDLSSFFVPSQDSSTSTEDLSSIENDYYDDGVDYEIVPGDRSNYNFRAVDTGDSLNRQQVPEDHIDRFYNDPDHKRFKKNRP